MKCVPRMSLVLLIAGALAASAGAAPVRARKQPATRPADRNVALRAVLDVERESQAYYRAVLNRHRPLHPFGVVYRMEREHEAALLEELAQNAVAAPEDPWQSKEVEVPDDRDAALAKAVQLEKKTVRGYDEAIRLSSGKLRQTLERLRSESLDHKKWFEDPETCPRGGRGAGVAGGGRGNGRGRAGRGPS